MIVGRKVWSWWRTVGDGTDGVGGDSKSVAKGTDMVTMVAALPCPAIRPSVVYAVRVAPDVDLPGEPSWKLDFDI